MFLLSREKYYEEDDILYSAVYGKGFYQWTGRMVQDPLAGDDGQGSVSPLLENIDTQEIFFMKKLYEKDEMLPKYIRFIQNPADQKDVLWPCDLIQLNDSEQIGCSLAVDQPYNFSHERTEDDTSLAVLFPYGGYPVMEDGFRYLSQVGEMSWKNKKIQQMAIEIARRIQSINESGYLYLDFHLSRLFFSQDGRLYLNFSNLIFPDRNKQQWAEEDFFDMEACSYPVEFAEPAIVQGKQKYFDYSSQNYSMAAMFFYLMFGRYAYEGRLMDGYVDDSERAHYEKFRDYHKMPVFIFEPEDDSNALGLFADEQRIVELWKDAAPALRDLFLRALCQKTAVRRGKKRAPEPGEWLYCFERLGWTGGKNRKINREKEGEKNAEE